MSLNPVSWINASAKFKELLDLTEKTTKALTRLHEEVQALRLDVERLKAREELVITKAEAAASAASTRIASELARELGRMEAQLHALGAHRPSLPPPRD
ncbi:hypothetical protein G3576_28915 [Roseomonas stagni]|uniref:Uncharacterized protein n=1 Tax=Falsiroseomonas algicola TaxID=2716930 RepID=A0A6M1LVP5_9PROT|nr:hypothetical protein [Falsiroseomonas algicola]NGM24062.1 hypothetical protein [Falsiroseomonas algicola]